MSALMNPGAPLTMSSREIAELTGKEHKNVVRDIRAMLEELGEDRLKFERIYLDSMNREQIEYHLNRELTDTLLTGYSAVLRRKVVARWHELEGQAGDPVKALNDPATLRTVLLGYTEKVIELESKLAEAAPKVEGFDRIAKSDGSLCITDAAKTLQVQPRKLTQLLQEKGWIYRRPMGSGWLAYQDRIQSGNMEHKITTGEKSDGSEWSNTQCRITPKGLTRLAEIIRHEGLH